MFLPTHNFLKLFPNENISSSRESKNKINISILPTDEKQT